MIRPRSIQEFKQLLTNCLTPSRSSSHWWIPPVDAVQPIGAVHPWLRNPYVLSGYRVLYQDYGFYARSLFYKHNELINIWTHLIPTLIVLAQLSRDLLTFGMGPQYTAYYTCVLLTLATFLVSTLVHTFGSLSEFTHELLFAVDVSTIVVACLATTLALNDYTISDPGESLTLCALSRTSTEPDGCRVYIYWVVVRLTFVSLCLAVVGRVLAKIHGSTVALIARNMGLLTPCLLYFGVSLDYVRAHWDAHNPPQSLPYHLAHFVFWLIGGFCYGTRIPERLNPGHYDHSFHSHSIMHVFTFLSSFSAITALRCDMVRLHSNQDTMFSISRLGYPTTSTDLFYPVVLCATLAAFVILCTTAYTRHILTKLKVQ